MHGKNRPGHEPRKPKQNKKAKSKAQPAAPQPLVTTTAHRPTAQGK